MQNKHVSKKILLVLTMVMMLSLFSIAFADEKADLKVDWKVQTTTETAITADNLDKFENASGSDIKTADITVNGDKVVLEKKQTQIVKIASGKLVVNPITGYVTIVTDTTGTALSSSVEVATGDAINVTFVKEFVQGGTSTTSGSAIESESSSVDEDEYGSNYISKPANENFKKKGSKDEKTEEAKEDKKETKKEDKKETGKEDKKETKKEEKQEKGQEVNVNTTKVEKAVATMEDLKAVKTINYDALPLDKGDVYKVVDDNGKQVAVIRVAKNGSFTFLEGDQTPLASIKIDKDGKVEIVEMIALDIPLTNVGQLPKTGEANNSLMALFSLVMAAAGLVVVYKRQ